MVRVSNVLIGIVNTVILLLSLFTFGTLIYYRIHGGATDCEKVIEKPLLITGSVFLVLSIIGLIGSCCKARWAMCLYAFVMFLVMLGLIGLTLFALLVTNKGVSNKVGDFSHWLKDHVSNGEKWDEIRSCLVDANVCTNIPNHDGLFYNLNLSPIQSGCCKPPTYCGFEYKNATFWVVPKLGPAVSDSDCTTWSNDQAKLCYDCQSCKGGVLAKIKHGWRQLAMFNGCVLMVVLLCYCLSCCAYKNNKADRNKYNGYKGYGA